MSRKIIGVTVGTTMNPKKFGGDATAIQTVTAELGLKATTTGTDVAIAIDDDVMFIFDCGNATSHLTGYVVEPNEGGGTTAIIGHENSTCVVEENEFGGTTVIID